MYFFLTNHCKMECAHCCNNASPRGRHYMSREVFAMGLKLAEELGHGVFLGGGEPTDHPKFLEYLVDVLASNVEMEASGVITNGSNEKEAILLSRLSKVFYVALSRTPYHDISMISDRVLNAFKDIEKRDNWNVFKQGRGKNISGSEKGCACPDLWLNWNGDLYHCGCKKAAYGNILSGLDMSDFYEEPFGECSEDL